MINTITSNAIDFIGDIHGHANELKELLEGKLNYVKSNGYYKHRARRAFFVGDFIDRGPQIKEVLEIVRPMVENDSAYAVIGNHEFNAICYWTIGPGGEPLRPRNKKNKGQHKRTIDAFNDADELMEYIGWFKTLPIFAEHEQFKVVHAQWNEEHIAWLKEAGITSFSNLEFLMNSGTRGTAEYEIIENLLKGEERHVPGITFKDKDGLERSSYRLKWWLQGNNLQCRDALFEFSQEANQNTLTLSSVGYEKNNPPVFFGHYWLKDSEPVLQQSNVCCLDFSVAKEEGILVAYSWNGERELTKDNFKFVRR